jgi:hypothetical protein
VALTDFMVEIITSMSLSTKMSSGPRSDGVERRAVEHADVDGVIDGQVVDHLVEEAEPGRGEGSCRTERR